MNTIVFFILLTLHMRMLMADDSSSDLTEICPSVSPDIMSACPSTFSEHTYEMIKQLPKLVPLYHPDYDQLVPPQARGKVNLYCAHPACIPDPCLHGGSCEETLRGFECNCTALFVGERCHERNVINDVKLLGSDSRQGAVSFLPIRTNSSWQLMSFWGWEQSTSDLVCKYLGFPGVYATIDGAVLNNPVETATLDEKIVVCPDDVRSITDCWFNDNTPPSGTGVVGVICCEAYECNNPGIPLGLESGDVIDSQITASSEDPGTLYKSAAARLHSSTCWQPLVHDKLQWLQVDLLGAHLLTGASMQGRSDIDYYVSAFTLNYSLIGSVWTTYKDELKQVKYFPGNLDGTSVQTHSLYPGVVTRYVRIQPWTWVGEIAIRLELFGVGPLITWDGLSKSNCSFDIDLCGWRQSSDDDSDWLHQGSRVPSLDSTPANDHTTSYGAYVFMTSNSSSSQSAKLQGPPIRVKEGLNSSCLQFWSHMNGESAGVLRVYVSHNNTVLTADDVVFERTGCQGDQWIAEEIDFIMDSKAPFYITFEGRFNSSDVGYIALDDVTITPGHCPIRTGSVECGFDVSDCGWFQDESDDGDWKFISGGPPSSSNQPSHDHSISQKGRYLYIVGLENTTHYTARLASPFLTIDNAVADICFSFWYYALSGDAGELSVDLVEEGSISNMAFAKEINITFNHERVWRQSMITISQPPPTPFSIVIEGRVKGQHILAIDDISLYYGSCPDDSSHAPQDLYIDGYHTIPASCAAWKRRGDTLDGYYTIDPDGPGNGVQPFIVYCDMTTDVETGIMVFRHDLVPESDVSGYEDPFSYPFIVTYAGASLAQIGAAADISGECSQYIKFGCMEVALTGYTAWYDRYGTQMTYWGGAPPNSSSCACGIAGTCNGNGVCECDPKLRWVTTQDDGNITHKASLPVSEIRVGDTGGSYETADVTLGPLYCKGDDARSVISDRTDFIMLANTRTPGRIIEEVDTLSAQDCAEACITQASSQCHSFSYQVSNGTCIMKELGDQVTSPSKDPAWNEYIRIWPSSERSVDCNFGKGGCGWTQDWSDDADWMISDGNHGYKSRTGALSDHTSGRHQSDVRSVRLADGVTPYEGRVEIFYKGQWASVCGITWSLPKAKILCQTLGFGEARHVTLNSTYATGTGEVMVELQCNGDESDIRECPMRDIGHIACPHINEAGVVCSPGVRLTGGVTPREGTIELLYNGSWGSICHNNWDIDDANVVCRSLGYGSALNAVGSAVYGNGPGQILLDAVSCTGTEESVFDCAQSPIGDNNCTHDEDAGVVCSYKDETDAYPLEGSYLFIDSSEQSSTAANTTRLQSPVILMPIGEGAACFRFWYYMFGDDVHTLRVYVNDVDGDIESGEIALVVTGNHGDQWIMEQFEIMGSSTEPFTITIEAITGLGDNGDIAIDDLEVPAGYCPYVPMSCDFEKSFICGFVQDQDDDVDWMRGKGDVIHDDKRPPYDHTFHDIHGSYMYMNSNDTMAGSTALLWTPPYAFPGQHCLTFYYFMHGSEIGSLRVYAIESEAFVNGSTPVWTRVGPQGYEWKKAVTSIVADSNFQIVFEAISGGTDYSNIAIDDVTVSEGPCEVSRQDNVITDDVGCRKVLGSRLGVEDGSIPDSAFTASSFNGMAYEPHRARLNSYAPYTGWIPTDGEASNWLQVDFGLRRLVTGALTQGLQQSSKWSTLIRFSYLEDNNERSYISQNECGISGGKVFRASFDSDSIVTSLFPQPVISTHLRIHVDDSHIKSALRCEVLGMLNIDCDDLYASGYQESGVYTLRPADGNQSLVAYCDMDPEEGGWTVFQRRLDGITSFSKTWSDYENGFGDASGEHWLGLRNLYRIVGQRSYKLRVDLEYSDGSRLVANYTGFSLGDQSTDYRLHIGGLDGYADDPLAYHNGTSFRTAEQLPSNGMPSCDGPRPAGGWWYVGECEEHVNLNGVYPGTTGDARYEMFWEAPTSGNYSLRFSEMKIKPIS